MHGELIQDSAIVTDLYLKCVQSYGVKRAQRMMGVKFRDQRYRRSTSSPRRSAGCAWQRCG
jgi:hypothetical protein